MNKFWGRLRMALSVFRTGHLPDWVQILSYYFNEHTIIEVVKEDTFDPLNQRTLAHLVIRVTRPDNVWTPLDPKLLPRKASDTDEALIERTVRELRDE